jgi:acetylornithine deacetylase/succinyl-diaminopimelate desuccinylase-like protein
MSVRSLATSELIRRLMPTAREDLEQLVSFRSVADPAQAAPEECEKAARYLVAVLCELGVRSRIHPTVDGGGAVLGAAPGPPGAPTVLLSCHYDVAAPADESAWRTAPFQLTEHEGRWYGCGAADGKGDIAVFLTALRALTAGGYPVGVTLLAAGSQERGTGALEAFVPDNADLLRADAIVHCGVGNVAAGTPTLTTTLRGIAAVDVTAETLAHDVPSGALGGPTPDALAVLVRMLATLHDDDGNTTIRGLDGGRHAGGVQYADDRFRHDAEVLAGVDLLGDGTVPDMLWARPALTILGIDCPPVSGATPLVHASARARLELRVPPGVGADAAQDALAAHLVAVAPWHARVRVDPVTTLEPFRASTDGPAYRAMMTSLEETYGTAPAMAGQGGSIELCTVFQETFPNTEIMIMGIEEPACLVHEPNESVDPMEIERMALAQARFLQTYPTPNR